MSQSAGPFGSVCSLLFAMSLALGAAAQPQQPAGHTAPAEMDRIIHRFYDLRARTLDERGTDQDIAALMDLIADSAKYEHPRANVTMTKAQAAAGIKAHLREGRNATITIHNIILGTDVATVELTLKYDVPETRSTRGVSIFEFANGRIRRIAEY